MWVDRVNMYVLQMSTETLEPGGEVSERSM